MHSISEFNTGVPAFLAKLWKLVEDPKTDDLICWSPSGRSFFIKNQAQFAKELLPHYYKHNNMASFVRQLNMYGFRKVTSVELGGLKCDRDEIEFTHQYFVKGVPEYVERIKRKMTPSKLQESGLSSFKPDVVNKVLVEVRNMKGRQDHFESKMIAMKHENEALWRELALMRQKHIKQQQIVNKLIHFLVTLVQPSRGSGIPVKRRYPLMIDDLNRLHKQPKLPKPQTSPTGPVIHELDSSEPGLESEEYIVDMLDNENPIVQSPQQHFEVPIDDDNIESVDLIEDSSPLVTNTQIGNSQTETDSKKRRACKGKKKNELHWVEMPTDEELPTRIALLKRNKKSSNARPIPVATMPSSKLAAMAANMKREQSDNELDNSVDIDDDVEISDNDNSSVIKLEDILIVPEMINNDDQNNSETKGCNEFNDGYKNRGHNKFDGGKSILIANDNEQRITTSKSSRNEKENRNAASTSSSKDLSLSCVNSGMSHTNYREEVDTHLETTDAQLDSVRDFLIRNELLRNDSCSSIDASAILGLFEKDDPMIDFMVNSDLNPNGEKENDECSSIIPDVNGCVAGGELMTYNSSSNLDFDQILLDNASASSPVSSDLLTNHPYTAYYDSLNPEEAEHSFFESIAPNDANTKI